MKAGLDALMAGGFVVPAAGLGVGVPPILEDGMILEKLGNWCRPRSADPLFSPERAKRGELTRGEGSGLGGHPSLDAVVRGPQCKCASIPSSSIWSRRPVAPVNGVLDDRHTHPSRPPARSEEVSISFEEEDQDLRFYVVVNDEEQYSIWASTREVPAGWRTVGEPTSKGEALATIDELWIDMRPLSLRRWMDRLEGRVEAQ